MATVNVTGAGSAGNASIRIVHSGAFNANPVAVIRDDTVAITGSPLKVETVDLATGFNELTVPAGATAVSIIPPSDTSKVMTLKGVTGDTGVKLLASEGARMIALDSSATLGLAVSSEVVGVQLIWM